jgi:hypothetical protein
MFIDKSREFKPKEVTICNLLINCSLFDRILLDTAQKRLSCLSNVFQGINPQIRLQEKFKNMRMHPKNVHPNLSTKQFTIAKGIRNTH